MAVAVFAYTAEAASHTPHKVLPEAAPSPCAPILFFRSFPVATSFLSSHLSPRPLSPASLPGLSPRPLPPPLARYV